MGVGPQSLSYGSLYLTLCFVFCVMSFLILCCKISCFEFSELCSVYNVRFKRSNSRNSVRMEMKRETKDEGVSILMDLL